ncbi:ATP-binding protein [Chlorogloeopsis sp. ULAP01]|uniref:sensor histidine kinase n=1 Tax=Chlorogloeopsis sp. ULAP01 TaxID=3056483 RepID=UPI0025AB1B6E|nr:ATP-binding protein [Chlorogloeopsis sp. ULAP01]MDM9381161.1 ATP-binding protein [Chlorogloeopsis sp. ULAP01]
MKWSLQGKWIAGGFCLTLLLMGLVSFASYKNTIELRESADRVQHTYETLNTLTDFYANMAVAESGRRGYIFLGSKQELERHQIAVKNMQFEIQALRNQIHPSSSQLQRLVLLNSLMNQRFALFNQSIELYQKNKLAFQAQDLITEKSVKVREEMLIVLSNIKAEEQRYLRISLQESQTSIHYRIIFEILGTLLSFVVVSSLCFILYRQWIKREKIEKLERSLAQEKELSELKLQLFSMISHEFRTPLSVILLSSQLLKEILQDLVDEIQLKNLYRIQSSAKLMNQLITDLLTLNRAEAGKLEFNPQLINVESFCLNLLEDLQFFAIQPPALKFIKYGYCSRAKVDEKLLYSILSNLLLNAIKYSPHGGNIYLILNCEQEATIFQVKDEGIGITPEDKQKIYEPLYRGQNVENIIGTGLGLAVVKKCVELHQGEIDVESEVGIGTTFTVRIPHTIGAVV